VFRLLLAWVIVVERATPRWEETLLQESPAMRLLSIIGLID